MIPVSPSQAGNGLSAPPRPGPSSAAGEPIPPTSLPPYLKRRLWTTPTRAELAEAVRREHRSPPRALDGR